MTGKQKSSAFALAYSYRRFGVGDCLSDFADDPALALLAALMAGGIAYGRPSSNSGSEIEVEIPLTPLQQQQQQQLEAARSALTGLQQAAAKVEDPAMTQDLRKIESVCRQIVEEMEKQQRFNDQARRLVDYYLPMLTKLLETYDELEADPLQTQNIQNSRQNIKKTVKLCAEAFVKQWDDLHEHQSMEIQADSDVLENAAGQARFSIAGTKGG
ncbi:MAG: 5-bromo-4-chloroindolyl phosphate hydrolysis family protein [Holdemania massiliensis]